MATENVVKAMKFVHEHCVILVKIGNFYSAYAEDAYIISYLFKYKIREKNNISFCSFPEMSLNKIESSLEKNKIDYIVVSKRNNYEEEQKVIIKQDNNYIKILEKAKKSVQLMLRIQKIYDILIEQRDNQDFIEKLVKIESVLKKNEGRKI